MTVLNTDMHIVNFMFTVFEGAMLFFVIISWLSRPHEKARKRYMILLALLIQYNIYSGLFPDNKIMLPIEIQIILAYFGGFCVSMYFVYYIYKTLKLKKLKTFAVNGAIWCLFLPFIFAFILPYMLTGNLELSRKSAVVIPFGFSIFYVYTLTKALWPRFRNLKPGIERDETIGLYTSVLLWATLPIIVYYDGSQLIEHSITNTGFMIMSIVYVRSSIFKSRKDYEDLQQSNEILQQKVKERTSELELANEKRVNSFINLMHETKTPLTLINNCLDKLIVKVGKGEEADMARTSLEKLNQNMSNFFDLNKLERGMHIYDHSVVSDFSEIIRNVMPLFQNWANSRQIEIAAEIEEGVLARADPEALNRVIDNLLENAIKYSDQGRQILLILKKDEAHINFIVRDEGPGISKEDQKKIFEPYFQVDHKKKNVQGMGMGLAMVKRTVDSMEGTIQVNSDIGRGTEVVVEIPAYKLDIDQPEAISSNGFNHKVRQAEYEVADKVVSDTWHNILIIEDQRDFLYLLSKNLSRHYNVYVAENGSEALQKLKEMPVVPDLIVTDIMMDEMDGLAFVQAMREQRIFQHIPIIFTTAISEEEKRLEGLKLGAVDFMVKPFSIEELKLKIESILGIHEHQKMALIEQASSMIKIGNTASGTDRISFQERCKELMLTGRESEIVKVIIQGKSYKETADLLHISDKTVSKHISNIYVKLEIKNRFELISLFNRHAT